MKRITASSESLEFNDDNYFNWYNDMDLEVQKLSRKRSQLERKIKRIEDTLDIVDKYLPTSGSVSVEDLSDEDKLVLAQLAAPFGVKFNI